MSKPVKLNEKIKFNEAPEPPIELLKDVGFTKENMKLFKEGFFENSQNKIKNGELTPGFVKQVKKKAKEGATYFQSMNLIPDNDDIIGYICDTLADLFTGSREEFYGIIENILENHDEFDESAKIVEKVNKFKDGAKDPEEEVSKTPEEWAAEWDLEDNMQMVTAILSFCKSENFDPDNVAGVEYAYSPERYKIFSSKLAQFNVGSKKSFMISLDSDVTEEYAIAFVKEDLENEPEIFNQDWLSNYIDTDKLKNVLISDVTDSERDRLDGIDLDEKVDLHETHTDVTEEDMRKEAGDEDDEYFDEKYETIVDTKFEENKDEISAAVAEQILNDPMGYLEDLYGKEDAVKEAIKFAVVDIERAAENAVQMDGAGHFLNSENGQINELDNFEWWDS